MATNERERETQTCFARIAICRNEDALYFEFQEYPYTAILYLAQVKLFISIIIIVLQQLLLLLLLL